MQLAGGVNTLALHRLQEVALCPPHWMPAADVTYLSVLMCFFLCVCGCQGLFRIAAGASKLKKLKAALDCSTSQLEEFYSDPHAVAGTS